MVVIKRDLNSLSTPTSTEAVISSPCNNTETATLIHAREIYRCIYICHYQLSSNVCACQSQIFVQPISLKNGGIKLPEASAST